MASPYYADGSVTIYLGDCREILPTVEPTPLVVTDPPYGIGWRPRANRMAQEVLELSA